MADDLRSRLPSVRMRVTLVAGVALAIVLVLVGVLLVSLQRSALTEQLDDTLSTEAERLADAVGTSGATDAATADERDDDLLVLVVDADGAVLASAGDHDGQSSLLGAEPAGTTHDATLDGDRYRVVSEPVDDDDPRTQRVIVAAPADDIDESVDELISSLLWVTPLAVIALSVVVWLVVGRTLRPVERIRSEVASIDVKDLDRRVPVPAGNDEIARLAATMNDMLARLESSVHRQQQFVADASHELRTPLTRMRTELEIDERDPDRADPASTRQSQLDELATLQQMIEDLLVLARTDAKTSTVGTDVVDLDDIVLDEARSAGTSTISIDSTAVSAAQVIGSHHELHRVVRNLMDNARRHARTTVAVELAERDGHARLTVSDDGPGIPLEDRERALQRFTRLDDSRSGTTGGAGLGLAIVDDIVARHGGHITIDDAPNGGARIVIELPLASDALGRGR